MRGWSTLVNRERRIDSMEHGAIPELVIDDDTGLLVPERDSHTLADALTRMMGDHHLRARLARGARKRVVAQHDLTRQNDELFRLLAGLARRRREGHDL